MKNTNQFQNEEIWKEIAGFEGLYAVSNLGRVMNLKNGRILDGGYDTAGYNYVILKGKTYRVHRLLALTFLPNPDKLPYINHIDENKKNNDISNLEWCSASYNTNYSNHKRSCKVKQLTKDGKLIKVWDSIIQINRELSYDRHSIIKVCKGKQRYAYGYLWQYVNPDSQYIYNHPVVVYSGTEYIGTFASAKKASKTLGLNYGSVYACVKGRIASTHGYTFKYVE